MAKQVDEAAVRDLLVEAIAVEHRLYQAAVEARADGERWSARAALAQRKEAMDLAAAARARAAACWARARAYAAEYLQQAAQVAALKAVIAGGRVAGTGTGIAGASAESWLGANGGAPFDTIVNSQQRDQDTDLDAELVELKRRFSRT
jgi:hypothetical protein